MKRLFLAMIILAVPMLCMADEFRMTPTSSNVNGFLGEDYTKAFDGDEETKWCGSNGENATVWVEFFYSSSKLKVDGYCFYTGNDVNLDGSNRNPKTWKLKAKNSIDDDWTDIDTQSDGNLPYTILTKSEQFNISSDFNDKYYQYFRFEFSEIEDGDIFEVGELIISGSLCTHEYNDGECICKICGYEDLTRIHTHIPSSEWTTSATQHWHVCEGTEGICGQDGKLDLENHVYGSEGSSYYICTVCSYQDDTRKEQYELPAYKQEKIDAINALVEGVESSVITENVQSSISDINAATTKDAVTQAYDNAVSLLPSLISIYNEGKADAYTTPASPGMRIRVTQKDGNVYERNTRDIESLEYFQVND